MALTKDALFYATELSKVAEACRKNGTSFQSLVRSELSELLGASSAQACVFHIGPECLTDPWRLVEGLKDIFGSGADVLLGRIAAASPVTERA
jgi:hypothetical protein